ncbi:unnamed protein product, partial [Lymnaea stagnalis]
MKQVTGLDKAASALCKKLPSKPYTSTSSIKVPVVKLPPEISAESTSSTKTQDDGHCSKKYKYSTMNAFEASNFNAKFHRHGTSASWNTHKGLSAITKERLPPSLES